MKLGFFSYLFNLINGRPGKPAPRHTPRSRSAAIRRMTSKADLQRLAQQVGNAKRLRAWQTAVAHGYAEKARLVADGKGRNTLAGIPAFIRDRNPQA
jgi:hypothetical protein